jgi:hypothetical protein
MHAPRRRPQRLLPSISAGSHPLGLRPGPRCPADPAAHGVAAALRSCPAPLTGNAFFPHLISAPARRPHRRLPDGRRPRGARRDRLGPARVIVSTALRRPVIRQRSAALGGTPAGRECAMIPRPRQLTLTLRRCVRAAFSCHVSYASRDHGLARAGAPSGLAQAVHELPVPPPASHAGPRGSRLAADPGRPVPGRAAP